MLKAAELPTFPAPTIVIMIKNNLFDTNKSNWAAHRDETLTTKARSGRSEASWNTSLNSADS
jgi:hypothetical protein